MERDGPCLSKRLTWYWRLKLPNEHYERTLDDPFSYETRNVDQNSSIAGYQGPGQVRDRRKTNLSGTGSKNVDKDRELGLNNSISIPSKQWPHTIPFRLPLLVAVVCCLINTCLASPAVLGCPQKCVCFNSSETLTIKTSPTNDAGALFAINCSGLNITLNSFDIVVDIRRNVSLKNGTTQVTDDRQVFLGQELQFLDVSNNMLRSVAPDLQLSGASEAPNVSIALPIHRLNFSYNMISAIQPGDFKAYDRTVFVDLSHNELEIIDGGVFEDLVEVLELNLSHNAIKSIGNETFNPLVSLQVLDLSFNNLHVFLLDKLHALSSLQYLYLNNNNLKPVTAATTNVFPSLPRLVFLDMSDNQMDVIQAGMFESLPSLTTLNLTNSSIATVDNNFLKGLQRLQDLKLDKNTIQNIAYPVFQNTSLIWLSIASMPNLTNITHDAFLGLSQLVFLNLSDNTELSFLQPNLFTALVNLHVLDLSNSGLNHLSGITFHNNKKLDQVFLKQNPFLCSCTNAWLVNEDDTNSTKFVDVSSLRCASNNKWSPLTKANFHCSDIKMDNTTSVSVRLGSPLLLKCEYETDDPGVVMWKTPSGSTFYQHQFHPDANKHLLSQEDIQSESSYHKGHYWHSSSSYYPELSSRKDRILMLSDGSLYIDYMLRTDTGSYKCFVSNAHYNDSTTIKIFLDYKLNTDLKICSIVFGLLCALAFFTLNVIYVIISWIARRLVNKRRREIIRQMLESLNTYKSSQITRIHENYTHQLGRVRNQYHHQRDRLHRNYTSQVTRMKRGCSNQVERVRDNYNNRLTQLRDYSSNQIRQIREGANNQIIRIRDYGSTQLEKLRETYKLQHQHVMKLLDTMNLDNCRSVVETECMRTESIMFDIDLLGEDDRTDSPLSPSDSEYNTAASSPASSMECNSESGLKDDMTRQQNRDYCGSSSDNSGIIIEMQTTIDLEGGVAVDVAESWKYKEDDNDQHEYLMNVRSKDDGESLLQLRSDPSLLAGSDILHLVKKADPLPTVHMENKEAPAKGLPAIENVAAQSGAGHKRTDSEITVEGVYVTPEASPTKLWQEKKSFSQFERMEREEKESKNDGTEECQVSLLDSTETKL